MPYNKGNATGWQLEKSEVWSSKLFHNLLHLSSSGHQMCVDAESD